MRCKRLSEGLRDGLNRDGWIRGQRHLNRVAIMGLERLEIAGCLRLREGAERKGLAWNGDVGTHPVYQLQEDPAVGATLVQLTGRMEVSRPIAECRRDVVSLDKHPAKTTDG